MVKRQADTDDNEENTKGGCFGRRMHATQWIAEAKHTNGRDEDKSGPGEYQYFIQYHDCLCFK